VKFECCRYDDTYLENNHLENACPNLTIPNDEMENDEYEDDCEPSPKLLRLVEQEEHVMKPHQ